MPATFVSTTAMTCKIPEFPKTTPQMSVCVTLDGTACSDEYQLKIYAVAAVFPAALPPTGGLLRITLNGPHEPSEIDCSDGACVKIRFKALNGWIANGLVKEFNTTKLGNTFVITAPNLNLGKQQLEVSLNKGVDHVGGVFVQVYDVPQGTCIPSDTHGSRCAFFPARVVYSYPCAHAHHSYFDTTMRRACVGRFGSAYALRAESRSGWFSMHVWSRASFYAPVQHVQMNLCKFKYYIEAHVTNIRSHKHHCCWSGFVYASLLSLSCLECAHIAFLSHSCRSLFLLPIFGEILCFSDGEYWNCGRDAVKFVVPPRQMLFVCQARNTALGGRSECGQGLVDILAATKFAVGMHHRLSECLSSCLI